VGTTRGPPAEVLSGKNGFHAADTLAGVKLVAGIDVVRVHSVRGQDAGRIDCQGNLPTTLTDPATRDGPKRD
jgi:hypothetical protein